MKQYIGKGVYSAIAIGKVSVFRRKEMLIRRKHIENVDLERKRLAQAKEKSIRQLQEIYEKAVQEMGKINAQIFEVYMMMIEDEELNESIEHIMRTEMVNAEYAVAITSDKFSESFLRTEDAYMQARAADIQDILERIIWNLSMEQERKENSADKVILCASDIVPSEMVGMGKEHVLAFVTAQGSCHSHMAIFAKTMNLPAVVDVGSEFLQEIQDGQMAIVDGERGIVYLNPDMQTLEKYKKLQQEEKQKKAFLQGLKGKENITLDGKKIEVYANINNLDSLGAALENDAGGIGLFRSEFLYMEKMDYPTEEEQFQIYRKVLERMGSKKTIIRTMDIGADKNAAYFGLEKEENPALGYRAIRICLTKPQILKTQLRALYRASVYGNLGILFPMITSVKEVEKLRRICEEVKTELKNAPIPYAEKVEIGIMIETPAAAMISDKLAPLVDFFSVGTNDLIQYTLACDRQNPRVEEFFDTHHEAVLRLIQMASENAHKNGAWIGICGELAADPTLLKTFLEMGIDELSVSPGVILNIRENIRKLDLSKKSEIDLA